MDQMDKIQHYNCQILCVGKQGTIGIFLSAKRDHARGPNIPFPVHISDGGLKQDDGESYGVTVDSGLK